MGIRPPDAHSPLRLTAPEPHHSKHSVKFGMWQRFHHFFGKDDQLESPIQSPDQDDWPQSDHSQDPIPQGEVLERRVGVGLPRQLTFRRQNSERRERLCPVEPCEAERQAISQSRHTSLCGPLRRARSECSPPPQNPARTSAPAVAVTSRANEPNQPVDVALPPGPALPLDISNTLFEAGNRPSRPLSTTSSDISYDEETAGRNERAQINAELDSRWILNLSMHFRDKSDREKFFVTYAESPNKWRRVTVSCDYRNAEPGSLEMDLKELQFQRDKSMQIYESIRDSLREIQYYDTVTNLKLETSDGRLHVHVTEDVNESIQYPPRNMVGHILDDEDYRPMEVKESELIFESHLSGFVYRVSHEDKTYIKKEIPGPDTVDEFLYEINALHALHNSSHVIRLEGIVVDDSGQLVKGLLISLAERGAIVDLLYDHRGTIPLEDRLKWARDAVRGLSEIHEEGYVQGDFTLSNIVVGADGSAKIIDINRRGCPVGWEPPEIASKIASHQRISMYIGEKTDLYQLGMTLWALAADDDEPERHDPPLRVHDLPDEIPEWYKEVVKICLNPRPRDRLSAKELTSRFPIEEPTAYQPKLKSRPALEVRTEKKYIDPSQAVERADIERLNHHHQDLEVPYSPESSRDDYTFTYPRSSNYDRESDVSTFERPRGRRPPANLEHLTPRERRNWSPDERESPSIDDDDDVQIIPVSPGIEPAYDEIDFDGQPFLIARNTFSDEELQILEHRAPWNVESDAEPSPSVQNDPEEPRVSVPTEFPHRRPIFQSRTSATSSSTPRNSQSLLKHLPASQPESNGTGLPLTDLSGLENHPSLNTSLGSSTDAFPARERSASNSPQPPASLPYADSGYDEPLNFTGPEVDMFVDLQEPPIAENQTLAEESKDCEKYSIPGFSPPPLLRSDTSIRISEFEGMSSESLKGDA